MTFVTIDFDIGHAIKLYEAGNSLEKAAAELGISGKTLGRRMIAAGVKPRSLSTAQQKRRDRERPDFGHLADAVRRYIAGEPMQTVANEFGVSRDRLRQAIVAAGHTPRTQAISLGLRYTHMSVAERRSVVAKAHIAKRGRKASEKTLHRRARTMEMTLQLASRADLILAVWLAQRGVRFTPQKAVGRYNLDIAVDELSVAVEVNGDWHYFLDRQASELARRKYLLDRGWRVIEVTLSTTGGRPWKYLRPACADKIVTLLEGLRADKTTWGQHCVIGGDGEDFTGSTG